VYIDLQGLKDWLYAKACSGELDKANIEFKYSSDKVCFPNFTPRNSGEIFWSVFESAAALKMALENLGVGSTLQLENDGKTPQALVIDFPNT
jgi:hypothetical protein